MQPRTSPARPRSVRRPRRRIGRGLVAALVGLSFVLQQTLIPLHLSLHEHTPLGVEHVRHRHAEREHADGARHGHPLHVHACAGSGASLSERLGLAQRGADAPGAAGGHEPHPAEDHLDEDDVDRVVPTFGGVTPTPPDDGWAPPVAQRPRAGLASVEPPSPRSPPPRGRAGPRAPPVSV